MVYIVLPVYEHKDRAHEKPEKDHVKEELLIEKSVVHVG
jgi:hypothetical protein